MRGASSADSGLSVPANTADGETDGRRGSPISGTTDIAIGTVRVRQPDGKALVVLAALTALVTWNRLTFDAWLTRLDLFTFFLPWYTYLGGVRRLCLVGATKGQSTRR